MRRPPTPKKRTNLQHIEPPPSFPPPLFFSCLTIERTFQENLFESLAAEGEAIEGDRNPLPPCGVCSEWCSKISAVQPDFSVMTFTSAACEAVYIQTFQ